MSGWAMLEVALGLIFAYLIVSLIASGVNEAFAALVNRRGKYLEIGITRLLADKDTTKRLFETSLVTMVSKPKTLKPGVRKPSYLEAATFADAAIEALTQTESSAEQKAILQKLTLVGPMATIWQQAGKNVKVFREQLERRYNEVMDRVSSWYKRLTQVWLIAIGFAVALLFNIDSVMLARAMWSNPQLRAVVAAQAQSAVSADQSGEFTELNKNLVTLRDSQLPIGWTRSSAQCKNTTTPDVRCVPTSWWTWLLKALGVTMTATAVSLGAPFWFDLLGKVVAVRNAGRTPKEKSGGTSESGSA